MSHLLDAVLVLNRNFQAIALTTVRRAFCLLAKGHVKVVGTDYRTYTMEEWLADGASEDEVSTAKRSVPAPRVIMAVHFANLPRRSVKFSRRNVYLRDGMCMYCGHKGSPSEFNLDHVVPVSHGGRSSWTNVVTSCIPCNTKKQDRTPEQAGMKLIRQPKQPQWSGFLKVAAKKGAHESWKAFLPEVATA